MHELAAVGAVVDAVVAGVAEYQPCRVDAVRVRRGSTFSEDALLQGFEVLAAGTALDGARLEIEVVNRTVECVCGPSPVVSAEDLLGHLWVCPVCGHAEEIDEHADLDLIDVTLTPLETVEPATAGGR